MSSNSTADIILFMKKVIFTAILAALCGSVTFAQTGKIKGVISDKTDKSLVQGVTVSLLLQKDSSIVNTTITDQKGIFGFEGLANSSYILTTSSVGYQQYIAFISLNDNERDLGTIQIEKQGKDLAGVTIIGRAPAAIQKGDTSQFSASQYKVNPDATT